jgi:hypothetical protein
MQTFVDKMIEQGYVSDGDKRLYTVTNDVDEAVSAVLGFYRNYHSIRWVGERLVVRMQRGPTAEQLAAVSAEFTSATIDGSGVEATGPLDQEVAEQDHVDLARITLRLNRRAPGRLRRLIDTVNEW